MAEAVAETIVTGRYVIGPHPPSHHHSTQP